MAKKPASEIRCTCGSWEHTLVLGEEDIALGAMIDRDDISIVKPVQCSLDIEVFRLQEVYGGTITACIQRCKS